MGRSAPTREQPLRDYRARRRFDRTTEPRGGKAGKTQGDSFVVQKHDASRLHYDFRLELDGVLKSWAVTRGPSLDPRAKRLAVRVEDHPLEYGTFEGTIPEGEYGGGSVLLWDRGRWTPDGEPHDGLERGKLSFTLDGAKLHGKWALIRMRARGRQQRENWLLIKEDDEFADRSRDVLQESRSVASGRSLGAIAQGSERGGVVWSHGRKQVGAERRTGGEAVGTSGPKRRRGGVLAAFIEPALATLVDAPPLGGGWIYEIKYDGYRAEIAADGEAVRIYSRSGLDWTRRFPPIAAAVQALGLDRALLDTEIVALDEQGRSNFALLQHWAETHSGELACFVFDLLIEAGRDLRKLKLTERKRRLRTLLVGATQGPVFYSEDFSPDEPAALFEQSCRRGLEGLIARRGDAPYRSGRNPAWLKLKLCLASGKTRQPRR